MKIKFSIFISSIFLFVSINAFSQENLPWLAVHDFTVSEQLADKGINGWKLAEQLEGALAQDGMYRIVTRAKIAKVLKEKNISSSSTIDASAMGGMVGADYIVTGSITNNENRITLSAKLIDVKKEAGEIEKSYDFSVTGDTLDDAIKKLPDLYDEMATRITMTPGELFDQSLRYFDQHNYSKAAKDFRELKKQVDAPKIKALILTNENIPMTNDPTLVTPGKLLDYGLKMMNEGNNNEAISAFKKIRTFKDVRSITEIDSLITEAEQAGLKQNADIEKAIAMAAELLRAAKDRNSSKDPAQILDEASGMLESILYNPNLPLTPDDKNQIEALLKNIKDSRKGMYAGPALGKEWLVPDVNIALLPIPKGTFVMGTESIPAEGEAADSIAHSVTISKPFWMGKYEITIGEYLFFLNDIRANTSLSKKVDEGINWASDFTPIEKDYTMKSGIGMTWGDKNQPMVGINHIAANEFCKWLTARERNAKRLQKGYVYRLPTEAEWEYVCRAGSVGNYHISEGAGEYALDEYAWHSGTSEQKTAVAGKKKPNPWGLYDLHGNVWEWCNDWYEGAYLPDEVTDPVGPGSSSENLKVARGGSFTSDPSDLKSYIRYSLPYKTSKKNVGFRVVCAPEI
ncbi:MAG: SUMF1/EgtB/PvdO family nonheme iron enzyme [Lentisphaerota bacterium]